jgi:hypothetical protein
LRRISSDHRVPGLYKTEWTILGLKKMVGFFFVGGLVVGFVIGWIVLVHLTFAPIEKWKRDFAKPQKTFHDDGER